MADGVVLVTGGARGIGRAMVETLVRDGRPVAFTFRTAEDEADDLERTTARRARRYRVDVRDTDAVEAWVARVHEDLGPVEALVNNAGRAARGLLAMTADATWDDVLSINAGSVFRCTRAVLPGMLRRRRGAIVHVSSLGALRGVAGQATYAASKAAVLGLTRALAREVGRRGVRVNAVAPGFVPTDLTSALSNEEIGRLRAAECLPAGVAAEDVAAAVRFLLSDEARSITGQCLVVDAGASA